jgi:mRNA interferase MazF
MWFSDPPNQELGRWCNSLGVRIPRGLAEEVGLGAGTEVSLTAKDGELVLRPAVPSDLVWLEFTPEAGSEQHARRPALILSPKIYNGKVGLTLFCPIMSKIKGYPFEVKLPDGTAVIGVVLSDQLQSLDWRLRKVKFIERASLDVMAMVTARVLPLLKPDTPATL